MIHRLHATGFGKPRQPGRATGVYNWLEIIQHLVFPPTCLLCGDQGDGRLDLCVDCRVDLPYLQGTCPSCGLPVTGATPLRCGACQQKAPPYDAVVTPFRYEEPIRHLIHSLKFGSRHAHARLLGLLLAERVGQQTVLPELIIPIPLHPARYRERGFNQSLEIARVVSADTGIPLDYSLCQRQRYTQAQTRLSAQERQKNIRNAFGLTGPLRARHVAILDDVMTTGATVGELSLALRQAGAQQIEVWACARALI